MTTIAWDGKMMAGDKRTSFGGLHVTTTKVHRIRGALVAGCGNSAPIAEMIQWYADGADPAKLPPNQRDEDKAVNLLVASPEGLFLYADSATPFKIESPFAAIGSGRDFAIAAMHLGCDARRAVEIASIYETGTGNGVDALELKEPT